MSDQYTYARFWRCALQVNPVGYNGTYRGADHGLDEGGYNQALLQKCLELDIKVVGLADHGSVASVDALRQVLQPHGIVVFPGFEIASNDKTHYVCLFPEDTTVQQLDRYLGNLKRIRPATPSTPNEQLQAPSCPRKPSCTPCLKRFPIRAPVSPARAGSTARNSRLN